MAAETVCAYEIARRGQWSGPAETITLSYDDRILRRKRLTSDNGTVFRVDLREVTNLEAGDALILTDGRKIAIAAADEALLQVTGPGLTRLAWHIGNRHTPCQIAEDCLLIRHDHVLADMLAGLGATLAPVTAPFTPEGGAYGHGRTMGHSHGPEDHDHGDHHDHSHA